MPLSLDEAFHRIALLKGDSPASNTERAKARLWYHNFLDKLTEQLRREEPGDLSITHESVQTTLETAYREYRLQKNRLGTRRLLQDE